MQAQRIRLEVAVPNAQVLDQDTVSVQLPLVTGYLGVLPGHSPLLAEVGTGVLTFVQPDGSETLLAVDGGAVEVLPDKVRVLADKAEQATEIDAERAQRALERANERLALGSIQIDVARAQKAVARAQARLAAASSR